MLACEWQHKDSLSSINLSAWALWSHRVPSELIMTCTSSPLSWSPALYMLIKNYKSPFIKYIFLSVAFGSFESFICQLFFWSLLHQVCVNNETLKICNFGERLSTNYWHEDAPSKRLFIIGLKTRYICVSSLWDIL